MRNDLGHELYSVDGYERYNARVAIHDSLSKSPTFIEREDPEVLVQLFVEELDRRSALIVKEVNRLQPRPEDIFSKRDQKAWDEWVDRF